MTTRTRLRLLDAGGACVFLSFLAAPGVTSVAMLIPFARQTPA